MDIEQVNHIIETSRPVSEQEGDEPEIVNLAGFQVTRAELFAHSREPAITLWHERIKFNMACLRRFPGVTCTIWPNAISYSLSSLSALNNCNFVRIEIHPVKKQMLVIPVIARRFLVGFAFAIVFSSFFRLVFDALQAF